MDAPIRSYNRIKSMVHSEAAPECSSMSWRPLFEDELDLVRHLRPAVGNSECGDDDSLNTGYKFMCGD